VITTDQAKVPNQLAQLAWTHLSSALNQAKTPSSKTPSFFSYKPPNLSSGVLLCWSTKTPKAHLTSKTVPTAIFSNPNLQMDFVNNDE
jgi:hypothetical protein